jgi:hypothetical protein
MLKCSTLQPLGLLALLCGSSALAGEPPGKAEPVETSVCRLVESSARTQGVPVAFLTRLIWQESSFRPNEISPAGAQGIAQFMRDGQNIAPCLGWQISMVLLPIRAAISASVSGPVLTAKQNQARGGKAPFPAALAMALERPLAIRCAKDFMAFKSSWSDEKLPFSVSSIATTRSFRAYAASATPLFDAS